MFIDTYVDEDYEESRKLQSLAYKNYNKVEKEIKQDLIKALAYAKGQFNSIEGPLKDKKYIVNIIHNSDGMLSALIYTEDDSFTHYGQRRDDGSEALVLAVCEYMIGYNLPELRY